MGTHTEMTQKDRLVEENEHMRSKPDTEASLGINSAAVVVV